MKTLTILRHAKSSWSSTDVSDHDRDLNSRGLRDRELIASALADNNISPDIIICSTALRARKTIAALGRDEIVVLNPRLYLADPSALCEEIAAVDDRYDHVLLCGHNPGLTDLVNTHTDLAIDELPTGGLVSVQLPVSSWSEIFASRGKAVFRLSPKQLA